jgi:DNA-binding PadR family transcriptional regulator
MPGGIPDTGVCPDDGFIAGLRRADGQSHARLREALGEFEQMVLLAILHLGDGVYGVPIVDEIQRRTGRTVAPAAVYITLRRLEQKGLLTSWMSDSTPERGGKPRRSVKITAAGLDSLRESRKMLDSMWKGLDPKLRGAQ